MGNSSCCAREAVESSIFEEVAGNGGNGNRSLYPMYLIRVSDFLEMKGIPEPHHVLKRRGLLHIWQPGMFCLFISHQWLGREHPDPEGEHMAVLREVLGKIVKGSLSVEEDVVSTAYGHHVSLGQRVKEELGKGYLFYDWFAIPQLTVRQPGVNEDVTKSEMARAVNSIPSYVEASNAFIVLVPFKQHKDTMEWCGYSSWMARGWCRAELWLHMLSSDSEDDSVIMINSVEEVKFMLPHDWLQNSISGGKFTVETDRDQVASLCEKALENRISELEFSGPLKTYRFYRAHQQSMLGQSYSHSGVPAFLDTFKFSSLREAALDRSSMNALMCAMFCGDTTMLRVLARSKGDVNLKFHGLSHLGYFDGQTLLVAAAKSLQNAEVLTTLIELEADVNGKTRTGSTVAMMLKSPQHLAVLQKARADLHSCHEPFGFTPLTAACGLAGCSTETVRALLESTCNPNPQLMGAGQAPLLHGIFFSRGQPSPLHMVQLLLQMKADPNTPAEPSGDFAAKAEAVLREERLNGKRFTSYSSKAFAILPGMTPLHAAAWVGDHDIAQLLLHHRADVRASNRRGDSPSDLAIESGNLHLLSLLTIHFDNISVLSSRFCL